MLSVWLVLFIDTFRLFSHTPLRKSERAEFGILKYYACEYCWLDINEWIQNIGDINWYIPLCRKRCQLIIPTERDHVYKAWWIFFQFTDSGSAARTYCDSLPAGRMNVKLTIVTLTSPSTTTSSLSCVLLNSWFIGLCLGSCACWTFPYITFNNKTPHCITFLRHEYFAVTPLHV